MRLAYELNKCVRFLACSKCNVIVIFLIQDGNKGNVADVRRKTVFSEINFKFAAAVDLSKCINRSNYLLHSKLAHLFSELPSNISNMVLVMNKMKKV